MELLPVLMVQNVEWEGPGLLAPQLRSVRAPIETVKLFERGSSIPLEGLENGSYSAVFALGSPSTAYLPETNPRHDELVELFKVIRRRRVPSFDICYSMQLFSLVHGGAVARNPAGKEVGLQTVRLTEQGRKDPVFGGLGAFVTFEWHGDHVTRLPTGAVHIGSSEKTRIQLVVVDRIHYLVQGNGQAATPAVVKSWLRRDGGWALSGTNVDAQRLVASVEAGQSYLRNTFARTLANFMATVIPELRPDPAGQ